jgi:hypothetical protein
MAKTAIFVTVCDRLAVLPVLRRTKLQNGVLQIHHQPLL